MEHYHSLLTYLPKYKKGRTINCSKLPNTKILCVNTDEKVLISNYKHLDYLITNKYYDILNVIGDQMDVPYNTHCGYRALDVAILFDELCKKWGIDCAYWKFIDSFCDGLGVMTQKWSNSFETRIRWDKNTYEIIKKHFNKHPPSESTIFLGDTDTHNVSVLLDKTFADIFPKLKVFIIHGKLTGLKLYHEGIEIVHTDDFDEDYTKYFPNVKYLILFQREFCPMLYDIRTEKSYDYTEELEDIESIEKFIAKEK